MCSYGVTHQTGVRGLTAQTLEDGKCLRQRGIGKTNTILKYSRHPYFTQDIHILPTRNVAFSLPGLSPTMAIYLVTNFYRREIFEEVL